jgi:hypothetical protein
MFWRFSDWLHSIHSWYSTHRGHRLLIWSRRILALGIMTASLWFIGQRLRSDYASFSESNVSFEPWRLVASWLSVTACTALGAWEWSLLVNALGGELDILRGIRTHLVSSLTKYVPGGVWPYVGKAYLATEQGVPASIATTSLIAEFVIVFFDGFLLLALCLPHSAVGSWSAEWRPVLQIVAILLAGASIASVLFLGPRLASLAPRIPQEKIDWRQVALVIMAVLFTWALLGLGFSILATPNLLSSSPSTAHRIFTMASAMLIGQVAFFVPVGLGIREAVFVGLLGPWYPPAFAMVIALAFRIEMILGEVLCALVAVGATKWVHHRNNPNGLLT